ncbi:MAG TPA: response regulator transcription factor, partial [Solirubrobacteraceae bacterium]|nr:response regulator transcription factor [Solirubrobacteraceae bacterium]
LADRALELWPRVPGAAELVGIDHVELLALAADARSAVDDAARAEALLAAALGELDRERDRARYGSLLARQARLQWALNRGAEALDTAKAALGLLDGAADAHEHALVLAWLARTQLLRGRFRHAELDGEEALAAACAAGDTRAESEVLCTLGMARISLGEVERGVGELRRAIELARTIDDGERESYAYANLADMLSIAGRTADALAVAREGLAAAARTTTVPDWLALMTAELEFDAGDWKAARAALAQACEQPVGRHLIFRRLREAELALGEGDEAAAARALAPLEPLIAASPEPQWIGLYGALLAELRRRGRDLDGARGAIAQALDRLELCTEDVMRIARVSAIGLRVEADIAQRARDLRERAQERDALARARIHMQRLNASAQDGGPVEQAWKAFGAAELARGRGRGESAAWALAASRWEAIARPYPAAVARAHEAEAQAQAGERDAAAAGAGRALASARRLGSRWLERELVALCERARLDPAGAPRAAGGEAPEEDPFGLTPRERQVLALLAEGATNRQIGSALYMAEKTASVHVSRILAKLGVQSRTQAAAVAHRLDLAGR